MHFCMLFKDVITKKTTTIKTYSGEQGRVLLTVRWLKRDVSIPAQSNNFKIILRGKTGSGYKSDAAIDNIRVTNGLC